MTVRGDSVEGAKGIEKFLNKIIHGDCLELMKDIPDNIIDLTVTSPPYDNLRTYNGFSFDFENIAKELYRVTKPGGVVVWVVGDATIKGSETGTSFKQALYFKEIGFNLHDTMIYKKHSPFPPNNRYWQTFEYMFVLSKGKPKTFNPLMQDKKYFERGYFSGRNSNGELIKESGNVTKRLDAAKKKKQRIKDNIWDIKSGYMKSTTDKIAYKHPAIFPERLAEDHILSWSNPGDIVFDPMAGSGTTCKMAMLNDRKYIGMEISKEYVDIANKRIEETLQALANDTPRRKIER